MKLEGSCACGKVRYSVESRQPVPYQRCYCSICRKAGGGGGYSINLGADANTLEVVGTEFVKVFRAPLERDGKPTLSKHERHFCGSCGCHLWAQNPAWPALVHPVAGSLDSELPSPPDSVHIMTGSRASWVELKPGAGDACFDAYPKKSLALWHEEHGLG
jgi:hypothetical protein